MSHAAELTWRNCSAAAASHASAGRVSAPGANQEEIRRWTRVVGNILDGKRAMILAAARLRNDSSKRIRIDTEPL
jgi:hypothetical protein